MTLLAAADNPMLDSCVKTFRLPPLILHPFSTADDASVLMESSRASLALQGFLPRDETPTYDLDQQLLRGRYAEIRMLYYIGKDITRWAEQCTETVLSSPQTTARLLLQTRCCAQVIIPPMQAEQSPAENQ